MSKYSIGLDFGTNSCRAIIVDLNSGEQNASSVYCYPSGVNGIITSERDSRIARQNPDDYLSGLEFTIKNTLAEAAENISGFKHEDVISIGVDATSCSPMPVDQNCNPLCFHDQFKDNHAAMVWLWKDHTALEESETITKKANENYPQYLEMIGGTYSSEWFWSKLWRLLKTSPEVFQKMDSFVEVCDWIPTVLCGVRNPSEIKRSTCAAGHKAIFNKKWSGLPSREFLNMLSPELGDFRNKLYNEAFPAGSVFGSLQTEWAAKLGLSEETVVSVGTVDAHAGAVGAGIAEGRVVNIMGTSTCSVLIHDKEKQTPKVPGISGIVEDSVIEGFYGIESGQPAVGDIFSWFVENMVPEKYGSTKEVKFRNLEKEASKLAPGQSGLMALDWNNGNRDLLSDSRLTGLLIGQTLNTQAHEIYRALLEATAFGNLTIINRLEEYGLEINEITVCGGLAEKNELLIQIYSDVTGRQINIAESSNASALGAAIFGAAAAGKHRGGFSNVPSAQKVLTGIKRKVQPNNTYHHTYKKLFEIYRNLHDAFGVKRSDVEIYSTMKKLIEIKEKVS